MKVINAEKNPFCQCTKEFGILLSIEWSIMGTLLGGGSFKVGIMMHGR